MLKYDPGSTRGQTERRRVDAALQRIRRKASVFVQGLHQQQAPPVTRPPDELSGFSDYLPELASALREADLHTALRAAHALALEGLYGQAFQRVSVHRHDTEVRPVVQRLRESALTALDSAVSTPAISLGDLERVLSRMAELAGC